MTQRRAGTLCLRATKMLRMNVAQITSSRRLPRVLASQQPQQQQAAPPTVSAAEFLKPRPVQINLLDPVDAFKPLVVDGRLLDFVIAAEHGSCAAPSRPASGSWDLCAAGVRREVVVAWLHAASQLILTQPFGEPQQDPPIATTADGLAELLTFAEAVGSTRVMLEACLPQSLGGLKFTLTNGKEQVQVQPGLEAEGKYDWTTHTPLQLERKVGHSYSSNIILILPSEKAKAALMQHFTSQVETLLYLAHHLELPSLLKTVRDDCMGCCLFDKRA